jgi:RND family efflux transporter MFP subunit
MSRIGKVLVGLLVAGGLLAVLLWQAGVFRGGQIAPGEQALPLAVTSGRALVVAATSVPVMYRTVGTVRSRDEIDLSPRLTARIVEVCFRGGDAVPADAVLIRLDDTDLRAALARVDERLRSVEADLKLAETELARSRQLFERQAIPQRNLDLAERNFDAARADAAAASEARREAEANLGHATLRAPMAAVVADRFADPGDMASPGKILMSIFDPTRLMLYVSLRESLVGSVKVGDRLRFQVGAIGRDLQGEVREIVPSVDEASRTFLVKVCIEESAAGLMPGMFGTLDVEVGREPAVLVPGEAIHRVGQLEYVAVAEADGHPRQRLVRTISGPGPETRRVVAGLTAGETVLVPEGSRSR